MQPLVDKHYAGENARTYDKDRSSSRRWQFQHSALQQYLQQLPLDSFTVIDAPVGTGRFFSLYNEDDRISSVMGLDYSEDMLTEARKIKCEKVSLLKHDLINTPITTEYDILVMVRFLNLITTEQVIQTLENTLPKISFGAMFTLRVGTDKDFSYGKIYTHSKVLIESHISKLDFSIEYRHVEANDNKPGTSYMYQIRRHNNAKN